MSNIIQQLMSEQKTLTRKETYSTPKSNVATRRLKNKVIPIAGQTFSPTSTRKIQFRLPAEFLDNAESFLSFNLKFLNATGADLTNEEFNFEGSHALFSNMRILVGGCVLEDINDLNVLESIIWKSCGNADYVDSPLGSAQGLTYCKATADEKKTMSKRLRDGSEFIFRPRSSGFFQSMCCWPLPYMSEIIIELSLADSAQVIHKTEGVVSDFTYQITNTQLNIENLEYSGEFIRDFESSLSQSPLHLYIRTFNAFNQSLGGGATDLTIGQFRTNLLSMFAVCRNETGINSFTKDSFKCIQNAIDSYQLSLGSLRINQDIVSNSLEPYNQARHLTYYTQAVGSLYDSSGGMNIPATLIALTADTPAKVDTDNCKGWGYDYWGVGVDMEIADAELGGIDSTATLGSPLVLSLRGSVGQARNTSFTMYGSVLTLHNDRSITITF